MTSQQATGLEKAAPMQSSLTRVVHVLTAARYLFLFAGLAFLLWEIVLGFRGYDSQLARPVLELAVFSLLCLAVVWFSSKFSEKLATEANQNYSLLIAINRCAEESIAECKQAEELLLESEGKWRTLFDSANDAIFLYEVLEDGKPGQFIQVNTVACQRLGYSGDEFLLMTPMDITAPESQRDIPIRMRERLAGHPDTFERVYLSKDGRRIPVEISSQSFVLKGRSVTLSIARDLTKRRQLEEQLRNLSQAVEQSPDAVVITDTEANIEYVNPKFVEITGYSRDDAIGKPANLLKSGETPKEEYQRLWDTISSGDVWRGQFRNRKKSGELYWSAQSISPIRDHDGVVTHFVAVEEDITERKQLEEQLIRSQKMESVGRLAGGVAHDFNNLLTAIMGYVQLGSMSLTPDHVVYGYLQEIRKAAERAASLTRQLLAFSHHQTPETQPSDLNSLIVNLDRMLRHLIGTDIELVTLLASDLSWVKVDLGQMEQVVMNLAVNASDAMPDGGKLIIETAMVTLDSEYARRHAGVIPEAYVMLRVTDTGIGMTEEVKAHIFEPFFTTKGVGEGTGLGLATCYGIVKQIGGHIEVDTEPGEGTTFRIYLLEAKEAADHRAPGDHTNDFPRGSETVLLAEDEPQILNMVSKMLRDRGYRVLEAANGEEALRLAREDDERGIHLLLTDVVMPQMGGKELAARLRSERPGVKVIFTSGYTEEAILNHGLAGRGIMFVQKPFLLDGLARKVREVLDSEENAE